MWFGIFTVTCTLSLVTVVSSNCDVLNHTESDFIIVISETGEDNCSCLQENIASCKTLAYVLSNASLNNTEVTLNGDIWIDHTMTVSSVHNVTIRSDGNTTVRCKLPEYSNDTGSGLVFENVMNLKILNITFEKCGTLHNTLALRNGNIVQYRSAVYINSSQNIYIHNSVFTRNIGRGLSLSNVYGHVSITGCVFSENVVFEKNTSGGGGISIEVTHCSPVNRSCISSTENNYQISSCEFQRNNATHEESSEDNIIQFQPFTANGKYETGGEGGGIKIHIKGHSLKNHIAINDCIFDSNSAWYGGGVYLLLHEDTHENSVNITGCNFTRNSARDRNGELGRSGGALTIAHVVQPNVTGNNIIVQDTTFSGNEALWGGGVNIYSSHTYTHSQNMFQFINCTWTENTASIGAAVIIKPAALYSILDGMFPLTTVSNCSFINNKVSATAAFVQSSLSSNASQHEIEVGVVDIASMRISFSGKVSFVGNSGSAIVAKSAQIKILYSAQAHFIKNTAIYGAAMALYGSSVLELFPNTTVVFDSNHASEHGGAIYATSPHQSDFILSHTCFISYHAILHPDQWNTQLIFINNTAKYGYAIYTDSLLQCARNEFSDTNVSSALRWAPFNYTSDKQYTIATSPASINFSLPPEIAPGEKMNIYPVSFDDLNQIVPAAYQMTINGTMVTVESTMGKVKPDSSDSFDNCYVQINGKPGNSFNITLMTQNTRHVSVTKGSSLKDCPPGFTLYDDECVCSSLTSINDKHLVGVPECNMEHFHSYLLNGYWAGCTYSDEVVTGYCPPGYCDTSDNGSIPLPKTCDELNVCIPQRRGQFCGECEEGYTVYFHSQNYRCGKCEYGAAGLLIYVVSEVIPLVLMFLVIMIMKLNMTSGVMQSLLLFEQTIALINYLPSVTSLSETSNNVIELHSFLLGPLSLEFFHCNPFSFCLWKGATVLNNLAFRYVTTFCAILLLCILVLLIRYNPKVKLVTGEKITKWYKMVAKIPKISNTPITHSITAFLILPYTHYTVTSFQILSRLTLTGEGGVTRGSFVRLQGNVEYFGSDHLPYAIPAVLVLLFLSLPPPLLLISYPLLWRVKARVVRNIGTDNDTTVWPIRKLIPLIDSLQGVFRDDCRMFAGLFLLWRVIIAAIFALSTNLTLLYIAIMIALFVIFTIHAVTRPYKRWFHNVTDILMLGNMFIITCLSWIIYNASYDNHISRKTIEAAIAFKIILMYLPLVFLVGIVIVKLLQRYNVLPKNMTFLQSQDGQSSDRESTSSSEAKFPPQRRNTTADEDLFDRAAEINSPPQTLVLMASAAGFELQSKESSLQTEHV